MTVREMFEIVENLCKTYGIDEVKTTINSMFEIIEETAVITE